MDANDEMWQELENNDIIGLHNIRKRVCTTPVIDDGLGAVVPCAHWAKGCNCGCFGV